MRGLIALISLLICAGLAVVAYNHRHEAYTYSTTLHVAHFVPEQRSRTLSYETTENGQKVTKTLSMPYTVYKPVYETKTMDIDAWNAPEILKFVILCGFAFGFGLYGLFVLGFWVRDKWHRKRDSSDVQDTRQRLNTLAKMAACLVVGFVGGTHGTNAELEGLRSQVKAMQGNEERWNAQRAAVVPGDDEKDAQPVPTPTAPQPPQPEDK